MRILDSPPTTIKEHIQWLESQVKSIDKNTFFIGHSVGNQGLMRWLAEKKPKEIGGVLMVAAWWIMERESDSPNRTEFVRNWLKSSYDQIQPWIVDPVDTQSFATLVKNKLTLVVSDNDPFTIDFQTNKRIWEERVFASVIVKSGLKHFNDTEQPTIAELAKKMLSC